MKILLCVRGASPHPPLPVCSLKRSPVTQKGATSSTSFPSTPRPVPLSLAAWPLPTPRPSPRTQFLPSAFQARAGEMRRAASPTRSQTSTSHPGGARPGAASARPAALFMSGGYPAPPGRPPLPAGARDAAPGPVMCPRPAPHGALCSASVPTRGCGGWAVPREGCSGMTAGLARLGLSSLGRARNTLSGRPKRWANRDSRHFGGNGPGPPPMFQTQGTKGGEGPREGALLIGV